MMLLFSCFSFKSRLIHIFSMILVSGSSLRIVPLNFSSLSFSSLIMMFTWYERLIKSMNSCNGLLVKRYLLERQSYSLISIFVRTTDLAWVLYTIRSFDSFVRLHRQFSLSFLCLEFDGAGE